jgi:hypothetical protein
MRTRALWILALFVLACGRTLDSCPPYLLVLANCSGSDIDAVRVDWGSFVDEPGTIENGQDSGRLVEASRPPELAVVEWHTIESHQTHRERISIAGALPLDFARDEIRVQICPGDRVEIFARPSVVWVYPRPGTWRDSVPAVQGCCVALERPGS